MKLSLLSEKLKKGMKLVSEIPTKKLTLPILENCLISAKENFLFLESTNLESAILWKCLAKVEKEGKICVKRNIFDNLISFLPPGKIEIESENFILKLKAERIFSKIKGNDPQDFPLIPKPKEEEFFEIDAETFADCLRKVISFPKASFERPEISGILIKVFPSEIKFVATDSFRLAEKKFPLVSAISKPYSLILPQTSAKQIINIFSKEKKEIRIFLSPNQIFIESLMFEVPETEILFTSRLIEGEYPNYEEVVPKKFEAEAILDKEEFLKKIKSAGLFSSKINEVKLNFLPKEKKVEILSQNPDLGEFKSEIFGQIKGKEIKISFNYKYLLEGISEIEEEKILFLLSSPEGAAKISPLEAKDYYYILMPIQAS